MKEKIIIAGAGGQGIMLLGKVIAAASMRAGLSVTWLPAYGAEVRGGTAYCMVVISDTRIGSPYVDCADTLIVLNGPSLSKFHACVKKTGLIIVNSSLVKGAAGVPANSQQYPFSESAGALGDVRVANMIALGVYVASAGVLDEAGVLKTIEAIAPADKRELIAINQRAVREGIRMASLKGRR